MLGFWLLFWERFVVGSRMCALELRCVVLQSEFLSHFRYDGTRALVI